MQTLKEILYGVSLALLFVALTAAGIGIGTRATSTPAVLLQSSVTVDIAREFYTPDASFKGPHIVGSGTVLDKAAMRARGAQYIAVLTNWHVASEVFNDDGTARLTLGNNPTAIDATGAVIPVREVVHARVLFVNGREYTITRLLAHDAERDLALIEAALYNVTPDTYARPAEICTADHDADVGRAVVVVGSGMGVPTHMAAGIISKAPFLTSYRKAAAYFMHSGGTIPGDSGGGVFVAQWDGSYCLAGVTTFGLDTRTGQFVEHMSMALSTRDVQKFLAGDRIPVEQGTKGGAPAQG